MNTFQPRSTAQILRATESFPSIPYTVAGIIRTLDDDNTTSDMLAKKIESDVGLFTDILKIVNSPRYAVGGRVAHAKQAVVILGFNAIRNLACMAGIVSHFRRNSDEAFDFLQFVLHSIGTACCAKAMAKRAKLNPDIAFISGMLHDVGQLAVAAVLPDEWRMVIDYKKLHDCDSNEAEQAVLGVDHARIGAHLVRCWNFPTEIGEAIGCHHQHVTDMSSSRMADLLFVAEVLSHALDFGAKGRVPPLYESTMLRLGLSFQQLTPLFYEIEDEYFESIQILEGNLNH